MRTDEAHRDSHLFQMIPITVSSIEDLLLIKVDGYSNERTYDLGILDLALAGSEVQYLALE